MKDISEIIYSIYSVIYQIILFDVIFGKPRTRNGIMGQILYGIIWAVGIFYSGHMGWGYRGFIPYLFIFMAFEILFVVFGCKGNLLCRLVTMMISWTTFILAKSVTAYINVDGVQVYLIAVTIEIILAIYIYTLKFDDECILNVRESGDLSITCLLMFFVTLSEVIVVMQDFRHNMIMGDIGWRIITLFIMIEIVIYTMISFLSKEYSKKFYSTMVEEKKIHSSELKELHKLNHELKNKVFYMKEMLDAKNYDKLEQYFNENFELRIDSNDDFTGNKVIDDCIKIKRAKAQQNNISFLIEAGTLPEGVIDEGDLTEVLFNLLDNAIDAESDSITDKWVKLKIRFLKGYIYIDVSNATNHNVLEENPDFLTSKEDIDRHGFGMEIIREIVNKYNGMMRFDSSEKHFEVNIMLML